MKSDVTNFLFKYLDKYDRPASVLFNLIDFKEQWIEFINSLVENYLDIFDFNQIIYNFPLGFYESRRKYKKN